jgi:rhodanese-related sulfurtransferase
MSVMEIGPETTMREILSVYPSAKLGLFRRYHIGGCAACGYQPADTVAEVMQEHNIADHLDAIIVCIRESADVDAGLQILPTVVVATLQPENDSRLLVVQSPEVVAALRRGEKWRLIDVRSPGEWETLHIPGAQLLTVELKFEALDSWPKDTPIIFYSNTGRHSLEVASYFVAYGSTHVRSMAGGIQAWSGELEASSGFGGVSGTRDPQPGA